MDLTKKAMRTRKQAKGARDSSIFNLGGQLFSGGASTLLGANDLLSKVGGKKG